MLDALRFVATAVAKKERRKELARLRYLAKRDEILAKQKIYYEQNKVVRLAYSRKYYQENREKALAVRRAWRKMNPEKFKALTRAWQQENPLGVKTKKHNYQARKRQAGGSHTKDDLHELWDAQTGICAAPHCNVSLLDSCSVDHVHPVSRGGSNNKENLQLLCRSCNCQKHSKTMDEWLHARRT